MGEIPDLPKRPQQERSLPAEQEGDLRLISELITDIEAHNKEHSSGAVMWKTIARTLTDALDEKEESVADIQKEIHLDSSASAHVGLTALQARYEKILQRFGLSLQHEPSKYEEQVASGEVFLKITDAKEFITHFKAFGPSVRDEVAPAAFKALLENLEKQVHFSGVEGAADEDQHILAHLGEIAACFHTAFPDLDLKKIDTYERFNDKGCLKNYIAVEQKNLWKEPGKGFGPADWVRDITPELLAQKWQKALDVLHAQEAKQEAGVAPELRDHLMTCIAAAAETLKTVNPSERAKQQMQKILAEYTQQLRGNKSLN